MRTGPMDAWTAGMSTAHTTQGLRVVLRL